MFFVMLELGYDRSSRATIRNPFSEPEAIKLFDVSPGRIFVSPRFAVPIVTLCKIPVIEDPIFVPFRIIDGKFLRVLLRPRFRLVPSVVFVKIVGASAFEHNVDDKVRARSRPAFKPTFAISVVNPEVCDCE